jgi:quercetin dioxygenase-like cupin family protein
VPAAVQPQSQQFLDCRARILAGGAADAPFGLVEMSEVPAGSASPLHVHHRDDEGFYVIDGEVTLHLPGDALRLGPGDYAVAPRGVPHAYRVGDRPARWLVTSTGGFERFVAAVGELGAPDPAQLAATAAAYDIEILGPPGATP